MLNRLWLYLLSFSLINKKRRREKEEKVICRFDPEGISKALFDSLKDRRRFL